MNAYVVVSAVAAAAGLGRILLAWAVRKRHDFARHLPAISAANSEFDALLRRDEYFSRVPLERWKEGARSAANHIPALVVPGIALPEDRRQITLLRTRIRHGEVEVASRNERYVEAQLREHESWFDSFHGYPLTRRQREAIVHDENNNLVVAGAGTGKTSTILGKLAFIMRKSWAKPHEVLLMAFTRKAKDEIVDRIQKLHLSADVRTFHSLGLEIIGAAEGRKPSISKLAEDEKALSFFIQKQLDAIAQDNQRREPLLRFLAYHHRPYRSEFEFNTHGGYINYLRANEIRTLRDEKVKSYGECVIANWLLLNGIRYEYEAPYKHRTSTPERRQYKPDFHLPDADIYIEYFGIDRDGLPPSHIDARDYSESMKWKRKLHKSHGTRLIETFAYEHQEGMLPTCLEQRLKANKVECSPLSDQELRKLLREQVEASQLAVLIATFLHQFKSNRLALDDLRPERNSDERRVQTFLDVFKPIFERYEVELAEAGEIDFEDMIRRAEEHVTAGRYRSRYRYIMVDEFQDISNGRARLLKALLAQVEDRRLFCVGDDWQAIFRFAGSDVRIMTGFENMFGQRKQIALEETFRFNDKLLKLSTKFILKNDVQIVKELATKVTTARPAVKLRARREDTLAAVLTEIWADTNGKRATVFVIGRYWHDQPPKWDQTTGHFSDLDVRFLTAHAAKGLEADYVVVSNMASGKYGFPTEIADDPILSVVLPEPEEFPNAEERRLFYVAITRARRAAYLIYPATAPSAFIIELADAEFDGLRECDEGVTAARPCQSCKSGRMVERIGPYGPFLGCTNYPYCEHTSKAELDIPESTSEASDEDVPF